MAACVYRSSVVFLLARARRAEKSLTGKYPDDCHRLAGIRSLLLFVLLWLPGPAAVAQAPAENEAQIRIEKSGQANVVDLSIFVPATPQQTWAVLTDWDRLSSFMSSMKASRITARSGARVRVKQTLRAKFWPFSFDIELEREIELFPYERMQFRLLNGDFDKMEGTVQLVAEPTGTRILSHVESVARFWVPPLIGPIMMELEMREQFREIVDEIVRRASPAAALPGADSSVK